MAVVIAAAHLNGKRPGAAEDWLAAVCYEDGQIEDALLLLSEAGPPGQNPSSII